MVTVAFSLSPPSAPYDHCVATEQDSYEWVTWVTMWTQTALFKPIRELGGGG